jgi:small nuclear ribonucleoprotein G
VKAFFLQVKLNGSRIITGTLRGYDPFMNLVIDEATENSKSGNVVHPIGMVVVRGNSVIMIEALERIG